MITDGFVQLMWAVLGPVLGILPAGGLGIFHTASTGWPVPSLMAWNSVLPITEIRWTLYAVVLVWLPVLAIYRLANWVWRHLPSIAGFGPTGG